MPTISYTGNIMFDADTYVPVIDPRDSNYIVLPNPFDTTTCANCPASLPCLAGRVRLLKIAATLNEFDRAMELPCLPKGLRVIWP